LELKDYIEISNSLNLDSFYMNHKDIRKIILKNTNSDINTIIEKTKDEYFSDIYGNKKNYKRNIRKKISNF
jgi:hypothetical protein